jgi:signal transduction histidine kinase
VVVWSRSLRRRLEVLWARPTAVDAAIAAATIVISVCLPVTTLTTTRVSVIGLVALTAVPLVWRRRWPVAVAIVVGVGTLGLAATGPLRTINLPYGQLVATYTLAALAVPLWRLVGVVGTGLGVLLAVLVLLGQGPAALGPAALPFVVAYALGTGARARRDRIAMLEERTLRQAEEHDAVAAQERARIAREIHDIVAHSVSIMVVQSEAGLVVAADPAKAGATFDTISATGREALAQLDRALGVLRAEGTVRHPQPGLADLPQLIDQARTAGLEATLTHAGSPRPLPADVGTAAYRVVQEALTNAIRHARARRVRVLLTWRPGDLALEVTDDGRGPSASAGSVGSGRGLIGMRERVAAFGGRLSTGAGPDGIGFTVLAGLPIGPSATGAGRADG